MKKVLITLAVLLAAGLTQAATINWSNTSQALDSNGDPLVAGQAYLVYLGGNGTVDATWDEGSQAWVMGDDVVVGSASYLTSTTTAYGFFGGSTVVGTPAGSMYAVIVTEAGAPGTTLPTTLNTFYGITAPVEQTKGEVTDQNFLGFDGVQATQEITPIPEPSTVALALVGVAAVALRRKFMKK